TNCLARRRVLRVAVPTRVVPTTQPGDLWGPSEELLFFNGLLDVQVQGMSRDQSSSGCGSPRQRGQGRSARPGKGRASSDCRPVRRWEQTGSGPVAPGLIAEFRYVSCVDSQRRQRLDLPVGARLAGPKGNVSTRNSIGPMARAIKFGLNKAIVSFSLIADIWVTRIGSKSRSMPINSVRLRSP
ncbi:MAG: hypothetical protein ACI8PQ_003150, partial [Planctomycetota bacterium]